MLSGPDLQAKGDDHTTTGGNLLPRTSLQDKEQTRDANTEQSSTPQTTNKDRLRKNSAKAYEMYESRKTANFCSLSLTSTGDTK